MAQPDSAFEHFLPGRSGPAIIAHGAEIPLTRPRLRRGGADYLEVDLWIHHGRFEARHGAACAAPPPVRKVVLRRVPSTHYGLVELLEAAAGSSAASFSTSERRRRDRRRHLPGDSSTDITPRIVASSQQWSALRAIAGRLPQVDTFYSIDVRAKLDLFLSVSDRDMRPRGVSCRHTLLSAPLVRRLRDRGLLVVAWTVDDTERARELVDWGVHGVTTHRVAEMHAEFGHR